MRLCVQLDLCSIILSKTVKATLGRNQNRTSLPINLVFCFDLYLVFIKIFIKSPVTHFGDEMKGAFFSRGVSL